MKCFILKTQDDLSRELDERHVSFASLPRPCPGTVSTSGPGAGRPPASLPERPVDTVPRSSLRCLFTLYAVWK